MFAVPPLLNDKGVVKGRGDRPTDKAEFWITIYAAVEGLYISTAANN